MYIEEEVNQLKSVVRTLALIQFRGRVFDRYLVNFCAPAKVQIEDVDSKLVVHYKVLEWLEPDNKYKETEFADDIEDFLHKVDL